MQNQHLHLFNLSYKCILLSFVSGTLCKQVSESFQATLIETNK